MIMEAPEDKVEIHLATPVDPPFSQEQWDAYQRAVYAGRDAQLHANIDVWVLPMEILTALKLPCGCNARLPAEQTHEMRNFLILCHQAINEGMVDAKGKGKGK